MKLSRFFDRWITETAVPRVAVSSRLLPGDQSVVIRIEQQGEVFDFPYTVSVQYADGHSEDVTIPVTEQTTEHTIALTGPVKRVVTKDDLALVNLVK